MNKYEILKRISLYEKALNVKPGDAGLLEKLGSLKKELAGIDAEGAGGFLSLSMEDVPAQEHALKKVARAYEKTSAKTETKEHVGGKMLELEKKNEKEKEKNRFEAGYL